MNSRTVERPVKVRVKSLPFASLGRIACPGCQGILDLCQPDANRSDRFLATCRECNEWWMISHNDSSGTIKAVSLEPVAAELERPKVDALASEA